MVVVRDTAVVERPVQRLCAAVCSHIASDAVVHSVAICLKFRPEAELDAQLFLVWLEHPRQQLLTDDVID